MSNAMQPYYAKTEFHGGPCDGDKRWVRDRNTLTCFEAANLEEIHVYSFAVDRGRMEYVGIAQRDAWAGEVLGLRIGDSSYR